MSSVDNYLICPHCKQRTRSAVIDSRGNKEGGWIRRRRACPCGQRYTTIETALGVDTPRPDVNVKAVREAVDLLLVRMLT